MNHNEFEQEEPFIFLGKIYEALVAATSGTIIRFLPKEKNKEYFKKISLLKKWQEVLDLFKVTPSVYYYIQYNALMEFLKQKRLMYITVPILISEQSIQRMQKYVDHRIHYDPNLIETNGSRVVDSILLSAEKFHSWLEGMSRILSETEVRHELFILFRSGFVSDIYIFSSPLVSNSDDAIWMRELINKISEQIAPLIREQIVYAREKVNSKFEGMLYGKFI